MNKQEEMKEVELNEMDQEKQPMTGETPTGTEKNGCVKVKVPEDVKFTGLSKEELMKVAGTAGWVRIRWILLALFWLGWVGMLAGAIVIIVQAPRCKPIPDMNWWNEGPLYQISNLNDFSDSGLKGIDEKLDYLNQLKVKGLILGQIHTVQADKPSTLDLTSINPEFGTGSDLQTLLDRAHRKGMSVVLNLTPNYGGVSAWFNNAASVAEQLKKACIFWLDKGFDGIFLSDLKDIAYTEAWASIQAIFNKTDGTKKTALMGSVTDLSVDEVLLLLNRSSVNLLLTGLPNLQESGEIQANAIHKLYSSHMQSSLGWSLGGQNLGSLASRIPSVPVRLYHTLLFTLPGTPVFNAGDEVGLKNDENLESLWDLEIKINATTKENQTSVRNFFKALSDLKGKERALLHGEYVNIYSSFSSLAFLRVWDQSERFIVAMNWGNDSATMTLVNNDHDLPAKARVRATTNAESLPMESLVSIEKFQLGPKQAVLLSYPFAG